jgi:penicillin-binding protein 1A
VTDEQSDHPAVRAARRFPWKPFILSVVVVIFGTAGAVFGVAQWAGRDLPDPEEVSRLRSPVKTVVFDTRGRVLHEFFRENRSPVPLSEIPRHLVNATIATEDRTFYQHWGVDLLGITRAAINNVLRMRRAEGGSTITQQLARNLLRRYEKTVTRKLKETALAIEIERTYPKDKILELYFNQIYFGEGAYGVEAAAKTFFNKPLAELTLPESALLAGITNNPSRYSPRRQPAASKLRREKVLRNMLETRAITQAEYDRAVEAPLGVTPVRYSNDRASYFVEMVRLYLSERYGSDAVYEDGLKVYTTLDMDVQEIAERALEKHLVKLEGDLKLKTTRAAYGSSDSDREAPPRYLQGALVAIDPRTGYVRALVGGRDWAHSNFNRAVQALRQPGSAFKPFVFTAAIDNGFQPTDIVVDEPVSYPAGGGQLYEPTNYDNKFRGPVTLRYALQQSVNIP